MARHKDKAFDIPEQPNWEHATYAVLLDIRDELKALNLRLNCWEVTEGFCTIRKHHRWSMKRWPMSKKPKAAKRS